MVNQSRPLHLLTVAQLDWRNGHEYALQAAQLLCRRGIDFEYRVVGDGPFLEAVAFARHELDLKERVQLVVDASAGDRDQHFAWADIFVLAAVAEGADHALDQAVAAGVPVVCTDLLVWADKLSNSADIFVVPRRNPHALADCLAGYMRGAWLLRERTRVEE